MMIPTWGLWLAAFVLVAFVSIKIGKPTGQWDFFSPLIGLGIFLIFIAFFLGWILG